MRNLVSGLAQTSRTLALCLAVSAGVAAATLVTGCANNLEGRTAGQYIDDVTLAHRVEAALDNNPAYKLDNVDVKAYRGVVQLSGFVNTEDQKSIAENIASKVEGVQKVENNISLTKH